MRMQRNGSLFLTTRFKRNRRSNTSCSAFTYALLFLPSFFSAKPTERKRIEKYEHQANRIQMSLYKAHGTAMVMASMIFASTGILFARYGRSLRFGNRRQLLGKAVWFQAHRFFVSIASLGIILGFLLILVYAQGKWVTSLTPRLFAHSIFGGIIVSCIFVQLWLAVYRCHPNSRFRFVFNWVHRVTGALAFGLSIPTKFIITFVLSRNRTGLNIVISLWSAWIVMIVTLFEIVEYRYRTAEARNMRLNVGVGDANEGHNSNRTRVQDIEVETNTNIVNGRLNTIKVFLLLGHVIVSIILAVSFIVLIWH